MKKGKLLAMLIALSLVMAGCSLTKEELEMYADEQASVQAQQNTERDTETSNEESSQETFIVPSASVVNAYDIREDVLIARKEMLDELAASAAAAGETFAYGDGSGSAGESSGQEESSAQQPAQTTAPTQAPEQTSAPENTPAPTKTPEQTSAPAQTTAPTQAPAQTSAPAQTTAPTQAPAQTSAPEQTTAPTQAPAQTSAPAEKTPAEICAEQGHVLTMESSYIFYDSTCSRPGDRCFICTRCGREVHEAISEKEHDWEIQVLDEGDCITPYTYRRTCKVCGFHEETQYDYSQCENKHHWVTGSYPWFNEVTLEWEEKTVTKCTGCNMIKPE